MSDYTTPPPWWVWLFGLAFFALSYYPTLTWLVTTWLGNPYYSHAFLVPPIALFLAWRLERHPKDAPPPRAASLRAFPLGLGWMALSLLVHLLALKRGQLLLSATTLISCLGGLVLTLGEWSLLRRQLFPLAFLMLMLPLPWLAASTPYLARLTTAIAAEMGRMWGIDIITTGAQIELPSASLAVGAPCSGVNSLAALTMMAILYAFVVNGPILSRWLLVLLAVPLALTANLVRVWLIILLAHYGDSALALRVFHDWSSPLLFLLALALLVLVGKGLRCNGLRSDI